MTALVLRRFLPAAFAACGAIVLAEAAFGQQVADPDFKATVERPAYRTQGPKVLLDEAHRNFHTADGRYKPFVDLITNDGYRVAPNRAVFRQETLQDARVLVIANARGAAVAADPAFAGDECAAVVEWVRGGGSLLLVADHAPYGAAAASLARLFGVDMSQGSTSDPGHHDQESGNQGFIIYTRESGRLADHPITRGRDGRERLETVMTFTGQSLEGPPGSVALLRLADTAVDAMPGAAAAARTPAGGRAQAIALTFGRGRVVVLGEAAMLSAQVTGPERRPFGMNRPGIDNRQWALNVMHWLSGVL